MSPDGTIYKIVCFISILDFEEQILKEQVVIEELNSNLTSFIVNNLHIESHDTELDANTSSEIVTSEVKEPDKQILSNIPRPLQLVAWTPAV